MAKGVSDDRAVPTVSTFAKCVRLVGADKWGRWLALVGLALVVSGFEAIGAIAIFLLMTLITTPGEPLDVPVLGDIRDLLPSLSQSDLVLGAAGTIGVFFVVRAGVVVLSAYLQNRVAYNAGARLSVRLLRGYLAMPYQFHLQRNSSELIRNAFDTVQVLVRDVLIPTARLVSESLMALGVIAVLTVTAPLATLLAVAVLGPSVALLLGVVHPRLKRLGAVSQDMSAQSLQALAQSLEGVRDITLLGREKAFKDEFARQRAAHARANYLRGGAREIPRASLETLLILFILGFFAVTEVVGGAESSLSVLGLFAYAALRLKPSLSAVMSGLNSVRFAASAIDQLYDDVVLVEEQAVPRNRDVVALPFTDTIQVTGVTFAFEKGHGTVLDDVGLTIRRGQSIGIVGPTGGGKSTLVDLILALLEPSAGSVSVDGVSVHDNPARWQANVGMVPQTVFLIDATLRGNICLGLSAEEIDEDLLREAVNLAQLDAFVGTLPDGLDTWVGERGVRVSGGQRQRIAIARALYRRPSVLVFDEGTSALDNLTEAELIAELEQLKGDRTIITIAHRLTTVRSCDQILLLEGGTVTDRGTYDELLARNASFRAMTGAVDA